MTVTDAAISPRSLREKAPPPSRVLRQLFLLLFLRGRSARGLKKQSAPKSIGTKLGVTLLIYAGVGFFAIFFAGQPVFSLAVYLHSMTFVFLGLFIASSAGEVLFNPQEAEILLFRPIAPRQLLAAKVRMLVEVSLWLAGAFNLVGIFTGLAASNGGWRFPVVHIVSTCLAALFTTGCVVLVYQLCLRFFGREKLEGLMTMAQVIVSIAAVMSGQVLPQLMLHVQNGVTHTVTSGWVLLLPPAWFAGFDDALAGSGARSSWALAGLAILATGLVLSLALGKLAADYESGLQKLGQVVSRTSSGSKRRRWIDRLIDLPPLRWWLRDSVTRASFLLAAAYLVRDRETKLRIYPSMGPYLVVPIVFLVNGRFAGGGFSAMAIGFTSAYMGLIPMMSIGLLQYSQQWQASDVFRVAPIGGPAAICHGARRAVLCLLALPLAAVIALMVWLMGGRQWTQVELLLPGMVLLPIYALLPNWRGGGIPLSMPGDESKSVRQGWVMLLAMVVSMAIAGVAWGAWSAGVFKWFLLVEIGCAIAVYLGLRRSVNRVKWPPID